MVEGGAGGGKTSKLTIQKKIKVGKLQILSLKVGKKKMLY